MLATPEVWMALALIAVLGLIAWKGLAPILKALDDRGDRIRRSLEEAQALREEAQKTVAEYKRKQREALKEAEEILAHGKAEAQRMREQGEKDIDAALSRRESVALEKIVQAEAKALQEVRNQAVDLAVAATAELLKSKIDSAKSQQLISDTIRDLPQNLR